MEDHSKTCRSGRAAAIRTTVRLRHVWGWTRFWMFFWILDVFHRFLLVFHSFSGSFAWLFHEPSLCPQGGSPLFQIDHGATRFAVVAVFQMSRQFAVRSGGERSWEKHISLSLVDQNRFQPCWCCPQPLGGALPHSPRIRWVFLSQKYAARWVKADYRRHCGTEHVNSWWFESSWARTNLCHSDPLSTASPVAQKHTFDW